MMSELTPAGVADDLAHLGTRIAEEHGRARAAATTALGHALAAGDLLIAAKALCGHGAWGGWLADHCDLSERTAQLYMKLARNRPLLAEKSATVADLGIRQAAALLAAPRPRPAEADHEEFRAKSTRNPDGLLMKSAGLAEALLGDIPPPFRTLVVLYVLTDPDARDVVLVWEQLSALVAAALDELREDCGSIEMAVERHGGMARDLFSEAA